MRLARRWTQDCERGSGQCVSQKRRDRRGHARDPSIAAAWPDQTEGPSEDRARLDETRAARALDGLEPLAYLAWPPPLLRAQAGLQPVRGFPVVSERQNFPANRSGQETRFGN